ncbi:MAG TPA: hypothetical protein VI956_09275, partial [Nitrospirota bacterium]|nr:hypothetical protein [Nitrospirota bacterium]
VLKSDSSQIMVQQRRRLPLSEGRAWERPRAASKIDAFTLIPLWQPAGNTAHVSAIARPSGGMPSSFTKFRDELKK